MWQKVEERHERNQKKRADVLGEVCVCLTIEQKGHAGEPLNWSDQQLHQRLPATFWLGLVDLRGQRQDRGHDKDAEVPRAFQVTQHLE